MTPKELVINAIKFRETPRVPAAVLDGYLWMLRRRGMSFKDFNESDPAAAAKIAADTYNLLGSDIVYANSSASGALRDVMGGATDYSRTGEPPAAAAAPMTELGETAGQSAAEIFVKLTRHPYYDAAARQLDALCQLCADTKPVAAFSPAPLTLAASFCGVQALMAALYEDEDAVFSALDLAAELCIKTLSHQAKHGASILSIADPVASVNMLSDAFFERFALPYIQRVAAETKGLGLPVMLHICGNAAPRLEPVKSAGIDVLSVDSIDLKAALAAVRGDYALFGCLSPVGVLLNMTADEVYAAASALTEAAGTGGGFILAPGCDLAPGTPIENIQAMIRAAG